MIIYFTDGTSLNAPNVAQFVLESADNHFTVGQNAGGGALMIMPTANFKYATFPSF